MRISDWSSDVCSSDLPGLDRLAVAELDVEQHLVVGQAGGAQPCIDLARGLEQQRRGRGSDGQARDLLAELTLQEVDRLRTPDAQPVPLVRGGRALEVGRTSCRERGVRYG